MKIMFDDSISIIIQWLNTTWGQVAWGMGHGGKWGNVNHNFLSVSQGVYVANMLVFMY